MAWATYVDRLAAQAANRVLPSLQLSLQAVMGQDPATAVVLQLLQVLYPDDLPRSLLSAAYANAVEGGDADEALARLADYAIIALTEKTVATHRLTQEAMRVVSPCEVKTAVALGAVMNTLWKKEENGQSERKLLAHYGELLPWMERHMADSVERAAALTACGAIYTYSFSDPAAIPYYESALIINERHYDPDAVEVAIALTNLGNAYGALGDSAKQKVLLEFALSSFERHYGPDHAMVAQVLTSLGNTYGCLGDPAKQKALLERALAITERLHGPNHELVARVLTSLGNAYGVLGDIDQMTAVSKRAMAIWKGFNLGSPILIGHMLRRLQKVHESLGHTEKALQYHKQSIVLEQQLFPVITVHIHWSKMTASWTGPATAVSTMGWVSGINATCAATTSALIALFARETSSTFIDSRARELCPPAES